MRARLATVVLCLAGVTAQAQPADDNMSRLESCIQAARLADTICSRIANDPAQRGDCFAKGRAAQLECLDRVLSEAPGAPAASLSSETARPEPSLEATLPKAPAERPASSETGRTDQPVSVGSTAADKAAEPSTAAPEPAPANLLPAAAEAPTAAIRSNDSENRNVKTARQTAWIISETTSPCRLQPARDSGAQLDIEREERPEYSYGSLPRPANRTVNSNERRMGRAPRQRPPGRLSDQRPASRSAAMDTVR